LRGSAVRDAVDAIAVGDLKHRLQQSGTEALALDGGVDAHRLQVPMLVYGMNARSVRPRLHERSKRTGIGAQDGQHSAGAAKLPDDRLSTDPTAGLQDRAPRRAGNVTVQQLGQGFCLILKPLVLAGLVAVDIAFVIRRQGCRFLPIGRRGMARKACSARA
jgi:hypothetical protein